MTKCDWYLNISKKEFKEIYGKGMDCEIFEHTPDTNEELVEGFLPSKLWRLNNLYTIVDKWGVRMPFNMNRSQHRVYASYLHHPRLVILKSRQQGVSTFWLVFFYDEAIFNPDLTIGLMAQGLEESATLLKRVKLAWNTTPQAIVEFLGLGLERDNNSEVGLSNGSTIFIRTSFRSATLQGLHISEYGKIAKNTPERALETKTGTLQAIRSGLPVIYESTAEGDNDFRVVWDNAMQSEAKMLRLGAGVFPPLDFKPVFLSWLDDPDCESDVEETASEKQVEYFRGLEEGLRCEISARQRNFWIGKFREMGAMIYQEYPSTPAEAFQKTNDGAFYATLFTKWVVNRGRILEGLYDHNLEVNVSMDLGMDDVFTLVYFQRYGMEWRVIAEYTNHGEGLEHYVNKIRDTGYKINWVVCPHDIKVKELGTGVSRKHTLQQLGVKRIKVLEKTSVADGIEAFRQVLKELWVDPSCEYLIKCVKNYSKEWDERHSTWKSKPNHNQWSHGADALRYMAMSGVKRLKKDGRDTVYTKSRSNGRSNKAISGFAL